jgi:hypothetical protein
MSDTTAWLADVDGGALPSGFGVRKPLDQSSCLASMNAD